MEGKYQNESSGKGLHWKHWMNAFPDSRLVTGSRRISDPFHHDKADRMVESAHDRGGVAHPEREVVVDRSCAYSNSDKVKTIFRIHTSDRMTRMEQRCTPVHCL
jgi:hypothetical protein